MPKLLRKVREMNSAELRDYCLSFRGAEETFPFGPETSVFKVAGKMFALSRLGAESLRVSLKCEPMLAEALRGACWTKSRASATITYPEGDAAPLRRRRPVRLQRVS